MEPKENLCQPPEYPAEMFSEYIESAKARALRASEIEAILGDDYDLGRLRELVEADRDGRCVVLQCKEGETIYRIGWRLSGNHVIEERVFNLTYFKPDDFGKNIFLTREAAQAALAREKVCHNCKEGWAKPSALEKPGERCSDTCERYKAALKGGHHENL